MSDIETNLLFKGHTPGGISCEAFVQAVRKHAVTEKKARDNEYIADYAMSCLIDDALHWSETLSEEVQGDWSLLRRALLVEYGSSNRNITSPVPSLPSAMVPVPAAAPPPAQPALITSPATPSPQIHRGRIQVFGANVKGYLSKRLSRATGSSSLNLLCLVTESASDACVLLGTVENGGLQFKFENLNLEFSHLGRCLGMKWIAADSLSKKDTHAALTVIDIYGSIASAKIAAAWSGPTSWLTWICSADNTLTPKLEGMPEAGISICGQHLFVASCLDAFVNASSDWKKAHLVFEPI